MKKAKDLKVFYLHGYKGSFDVTTKGKYLKERVNEYRGINMDLDFPGSRTQIFEYGMYVQKEELKKYPSDYFDVIIGHSFGGGVLIKLMEIEGFISPKTRIILLGASIFARFPDLKMNDHQRKFEEIIIVHGTSDKIIEFKSSTELYDLFSKKNESVKLVTVENGRHSLTNLCRMKDEEIGSYIYLLTAKMEEIPEVVINNEKKMEKNEKEESESDEKERNKESRGDEEEEGDLFLSFL